MKKILIFYGSYGGGHIAAANSIKDYLTKNYPGEIEIESIDCIEYVNKALNKVTTKAYVDMAKHTPWLWKRVYEDSEVGSLSKISEASNRIMAKKLNHLIQEYGPDLIISTHPFSNQMCTHLRKKGLINCKIATILTDMMPHSQWLVNSEYIDYFFVANQEMKDLMSDEGIPEFKIFVSGIPLSERFKEAFDSQKIFEEFGLIPGKTTVLFFAGGAFGIGKRTTTYIFRALVRLMHEYQIIAVCGKNKRMKEKFDKIVDSYGIENRVKVLPFTNKVPELMHISDFVVTKPGGLTLTESLASGLPLLIINPIPGQEEENADFLVRHGAGIWIKKEDEVAKTIKHVYRHPEMVSEMRESVKTLARPDSTKNICEVLMNTL